MSRKMKIYQARNYRDQDSSSRPDSAGVGLEEKPCITIIQLPLDVVLHICTFLNSDSLLALFVVSRQAVRNCDGPSFATYRTAS